MRATLSREKKDELAFAALTHSFVGEKSGKFSFLKFKPQNDLGLDGFYEKAYVTEVTDFKTNMHMQKNAEQLEMNLLNAESIDQCTLTDNGKNFANDYYKQVATDEQKEGKAFGPRLKAFKEQILVMYTLKSQKDLFNSFSNTLKDLNKASVLDKDYINETVQDLFPEENLKLDGNKEKVEKASKTNQKDQEFTA
jgi:hypothetical protein